MLGCIAIETGCAPVGWYTGFSGVNVPAVVLMRYP